MEWNPTHLSYRQTGYFSRLMTDYLDQAGNLSPFYSYPANPEGMRSALAARKAGKPVLRATLVSGLEEQYAGMPDAPRVKENIASLARPNTFTLCTAHQPAIFTGHLYFIYKILHTIRLAEWMKEQYPNDHFVPVFYMGSEDADLEELGHITLGGEKLVWDTKQTGAVGRMSTKGLDKLYYRIEGELSVQPHGPELMALLKEAYLQSPDIQTATFKFLHGLFAGYGLLVLIADKAAFKRQMIAVFEDDLFRQEPSRIVNDSITELSKSYDIQANPRDINLFYLKDDLRGRIEKIGEVYKIHGSTLTFTESSLREELHEFPERFSPNVILRGLFQETILPNLAFIGGGGESAYWLELKALFDHYQTPFPVLVLRSSFQLVEKEWLEKMERAGFGVEDLFRDEQDLMTELVRRDSAQTLSLEEEIAAANQYYEGLKALARPVDPTLEEHVAALQVKAVEPIRLLEKKLLKAEKRKFGDQQRQIHAVKEALFPGGNLQERVDNILPWYAANGPSIIRQLYNHTPVWGTFVVLVEQ
ncbi:MAG TPA: bacillithiol biosynthesis cysteine-adding enzyme BshC [Puia sp.]